MFNTMNSVLETSVNINRKEIDFAQRWEQKCREMFIRQCVIQYK